MTKSSAPVSYTHLDVYKRQGQSSFTIPFDRQALADYLSVDRSAMSTELGKLKSEGIIDFNRNHFTLLRRDQ